jgi:hypothetical protein
LPPYFKTGVITFQINDSGCLVYAIAEVHGVSCTNDNRS